MQQDKYNFIADDIEQRIANGEFDQLLPSTRQLTQEYSVSKRTFDKAMKRLKSAGIILPGARGTLLNPERTPRKRTGIVAIVHDDWIKSQSFARMLELLKSSSIAQTHSIQAIPISKVGSFAADGYIFFGCYDHRIAENFYRNGIAAVSLNMQGDDSALSYADLSYKDPLLKSINALISCGIKSIAFYHPLSPSPDGFANWKKLYNEFIQERQAFMLKMPELDLFMPRQSNSGQEFVDFLLKQRAFPEVILQLNWHSELFDALQKRHITPGKDCQLMSFMITEQIAASWVNAAARMLQKRMRNAYAPIDRELLALKGEFIECNSYEEFLSDSKQ